jgi:DNA-binding CsgD family transcriptional regulator
MLGEGKTSKEIATSLGLSVLTIGNYRKQLCHKLEIHSTAELVAQGANYLRTKARPGSLV